MKIRSKPFTQIDTEYLITSAELRKALNLKGEIKEMGLQQGRSPKDIVENKSPEKDVWFINTREIIKK